MIDSELEKIIKDNCLADNKQDCLNLIREKCPSLDPSCITQMDYMFMGKKEFMDSIKSALGFSRNPFDEQYHMLCDRVIRNGTWIKNERTGKNCLTYFGDMFKFDLSTGKFPLITTKKILTDAMIGELLGFIRGIDNAKGFRDLGCNFWNANANESKHWLENPNRKGEDDLGRIYGVQSREWGGTVDQLKNVYDKLVSGVDDRRLIVSHWNPGEMNQMALPPCHLLYQFAIRGGYLDMCLYQRSCDVALGVPINIASYALLLSIMAKLTNLKPGVFTHFMWNIHIYEDQMDGIQTQMKRDSYEAPTLAIDDNIKSLNDLETWATPENFIIENYKHHAFIKFTFSV